MKPAEELEKTLPTIPLVVEHGAWTRVVKYKYTVSAPPGRTEPEPLWGGGPVLVGGRFTPKGSFPCVYLASDAVTALQEVRAYFNLPGVPAFTIRTPSWAVFAVEGVVEAVLDLTDPAVLVALGTTTQELTGDWRWQQGEYLAGTGPLPPTQLLGEVAFNLETVSGVKYRSSRDVDRGVNVAVFPERLFGASHLEIYDSSDCLNGHLPK